MKLYTSPASPFGARVMIAARVKGVTLACIRPTAAMLRSPEYLALNPVGKIPVLLTEGGGVVAESEAIIYYLEDRFPTPCLRPEDPDQRARINVAIRMMDTYVMAPVIRLFPHLDPAKRDQSVVDEELLRWKKGLAALAHFTATPLPGAEADVSLADCILPPSLHLSMRIARLLGLSDLLRPHRALADYYSRMEAHPLVGPILEEMTTAQAAHDTGQTARH